ncbi:35 member F2 [Seminavis robusta]|uniref:35 member F2 n=1 Tax=Seminavis robusta TaxID=568900 RepID=A0A9N8EK81_9STRA|nr:35 member F2 [Seminavis robusta]|eukprot:Sro1395_g269010.1 35 member F2 (403) ;mRNA; f:1433-2641
MATRHDDDDDDEPKGFWQAVQQRRQESDQEAAADARRQQQSRCHAILLGQFVAFVAASVNVTSFTLENSYQVVAPLSQLFVMYIFLSLHLLLRSPPPPPQDNEHQQQYRMPLFGFRLKIPWYIYLFFSCLDVGAGVIMLLSLQYTSLTSVTLLGSLTVPSTMLFSKFLLDKSFGAHHVWGVCLCLLGGCLTIWADLDDPDAFIINGGDMMAITAALLYGLGDAVSEYSIKHIDRMEFLGMMGFFGMILTGIQFPFQEGHVLAELFGDPKAHTGALVLMASYVSLLLLYYVTEAYFLVSSDATLLNLCLQAQNLWAILFSVLSHQAAPPGLFYLAVVLVFLGVAAYEVGPSSDPVEQIIVTSVQSQQQDQELVTTSSPDTTEMDSKRKQGGAEYDSIQQIEII